MLALYLVYLHPVVTVKYTVDVKHKKIPEQLILRKDRYFPVIEGIGAQKHTHKTSIRLVP
jgi:hypothetical protein